MSSGDYSIKKFDLSKIKDHKTIVIVGRRGTGKSTLITDILYHKRKMPAGIVISGTEEGNGYYQQFVPDSFIYNAYDPDIVKRLIARQKHLTKTHPKNSECFLLMDDCLYDPKFLKTEIMRFLWMNGRHFRILVMLAAQYLMDIPSAVRANTDYVFVFTEPILKNRKKLYEHFFGVFKSFAQFEAVYKACTADFECLVLDCTVPSNNPEDCVFFYKAETHEPFRIGAPDYWKYHKKSYGDGDKADKGEVMDVNGVRVRKFN